MSTASPRIAALVVACVVAADQLSKHLILNNVDSDDRIHLVGPVHVVRRFNTGGAFSVADGHIVFPWIVSFLVLILVTWFVRALRRDDPRMRGLSLIAISAMVGGALGNQVDRLFRGAGWNKGAVVDFLATGFWPVFNLADSALFCGALTIAVLAFRAPHSDVGPHDEQ